MYKQTNKTYADILEKVEAATAQWIIRKKLQALKMT